MEMLLMWLALLRNKKTDGSRILKESKLCSHNVRKIVNARKDEFLVGMVFIIQLLLCMVQVL